MNKIPTKTCRICEKTSGVLVNVTIPKNSHLTRKYLLCANVTVSI